MCMDSKNRNPNLSEEAKAVLYKQATEAPFSGAYVHNHEQGMYRCAGCGTPLFASDAKFDSGTGWPSFTKALPNAIHQHEDLSYGMRRIEVTCANCGGHLGHIFPDGPANDEHPEGTGARLCINSCALDFKKEED